MEETAGDSVGRTDVQRCNQMVQNKDLGDKSPTDLPLVLSLRFYLANNNSTTFQNGNASSNILKKIRWTPSQEREFFTFFNSEMMSRLRLKIANSNSYEEVLLGLTYLTNYCSSKTKPVNTLEFNSSKWFDQDCYVWKKQLRTLLKESQLCGNLK